MKISAVARNTGVGVETVRFYERQGLIAQPPRPSDGGFRSYPPEVLERIRFIRQAQSLGFSLKEIDELLSLRADPSADCGDVRQRAQSKLEEVEEKIASLTTIRSALRGLIDACPGEGAARFCSILDSLDSGAMGETQSEKRRR